LAEVPALAKKTSKKVQSRRVCMGGKGRSV
jgi:hypothetical protein